MANRSIKIELIVDSAGAVQKLREFDGATTQTKEKATAASSAVDGLSSVITRYASAAAILAAVRSTIQFGDAIETMSLRTGIGTRELQKLSYAAGQNGSDIQTLTSAVGILQDRLAGGDDSAVKALKDLGLNFDAIRRMSMDQVLYAVAGAVKGVVDANKQVEISKGLFGRGGDALLPTLKSDLEGAGDRLERFGLLMGRDTVEAASGFDKGMKTVSLAIKTTIADMITLGPHLQNVLKAIADPFGTKFPEAIGAMIDPGQTPTVGAPGANAGAPLGEGPSADAALKETEARFGTLQKAWDTTVAAIEKDQEKFTASMVAFEGQGVKTLSETGSLFLKAGMQFESAFASQMATAQQIMRDGLTNMDKLLAESTDRLNALMGQSQTASGFASLDADRAKQLQAIDAEYAKAVAAAQSGPEGAALSGAALYAIAGGATYDAARANVEMEYAIKTGNLASSPAISSPSETSGGAAVGATGSQTFWMSGGSGSWKMSAGGWGSVPSFGSGGFAARPQLAIVGDAPGGEFIVPAGKMGMTVIVNAQGAMFENDRAIDRLTEKVQAAIAAKYGQGGRLPARA
jgi:hypothetical protein